MMPKFLYLVRHAKAAPGDDSTPDHDRPLDPSGVHEAMQMGRHFAARHQAPDLVLSSTAERAAQTAAQLAAAFERPPPIDYERGLYGCGPGVLLRRLHTVGPDVGSVMIVSHNPDLHQLALSLAADGKAGLLAALRTKFPTGALAALVLDISTWSAVRPGGARLEEFLVPADLI
jgi:phosphohistidine phosphatase